MTMKLEITLEQVDILLAALEAQCRNYERSISRRGSKEMRKHLHNELRKVEDLHTYLHDKNDEAENADEASYDHFNRFIAGDR